MKNRFIAIIFIIFIFAFGIDAGINIGAEHAYKFKKGNGANFQEHIESILNEQFPMKNKWINANGLFQKGLGITANLEKDWFKMSDGSLIYSMKKQDRQKIRAYADAVVDLSKYLQKDGTPVCYVQLPYKVTDDKELPPGVNEYGNENADLLVSYIRNAGVDAIDLRGKAQNNNLSHSDMFFKTDHHWTPKMALWAAGEISEHTSQLISWKHDSSLFELSNFKVTTYPNRFLGSLGKKMGNWYAGTDDFDVVIPNEDGYFQFEAQSSAGLIQRAGSFEDVMIVKSNLKKDYFDINTYATYTGGDYKINTVKNDHGVNQKKVLLIRDSFSCAMMPFFSRSVSELTTIDLRHYEKTLYEHLSRNHYDVVLIAYNPSAFSEKQFSFK